MMKFRVEWLEGYGEDQPRRHEPLPSGIYTMEDFVSEEFNLEAYWGDAGMIDKLRELLTSRVGKKEMLANGMGEKVVATKVEV